MKKGITRKLFLITFIVMFVFISAAMLFQYAFFETFYLNRKIANMKDSVTAFRKIVKDQAEPTGEGPGTYAYTTAGKTAAAEPGEMQTLRIKVLTPSGIVGSVATASAIQAGSVTAETGASGLTGLPAYPAVPMLEATTVSSLSIRFIGATAAGTAVYGQEGLEPAATVSTHPEDVMFTLSNMATPVNYVTGMKQLESENNSILAVLDLKNDSIQFSADSYSSKDQAGQPNIFLLDTALFSEVTQEIGLWKNDKALYDKVVRDGQEHVAKLDDGSGSTRRLLVISPVKDNNSTTRVIFSLATLQPINEAAEVIKEYSVYIFSAAAVLIILLSLIFSNMISKPLLRINKSALQMAQLDFSTVCPVTSRDELGNLSSTLNFLSEKLARTLGELNDANGRLVEDIRQQKRQERLRKEFIASVSHELKTPVSLIQGYAEGIRDEIAPAEERDFYMDVILDEAERMSGLITDMLDLSQLESGSFKLELEEFDVPELIAGIIRKHSPDIAEKQIRLEFDTTSGEIPVIADRSRIHQVFTNLFDNAVKHTPDGKDLNVSIHNKENSVRVEVENQGKPIPEEELENIWERFYKVDKSGSRDRQGGGYGIGLAVARSILELHHAEYGVKNTADGVMFYFELKKTSIDE